MEIAPRATLFLLGAIALAVALLQPGGGTSASQAGFETPPKPETRTGEQRAAHAADTRLAALPATPARADHPWCVAPSASSARGFDSWAARIAAAGVTWVRNFPRRRPEPALTTARTHALSLSGIFLYSPVSPASFPIDDLPGWSAHVRALVTGTRGQVRHFEVWNEPPNFSRNKSPRDYGRIVEQAYDVARAIDPQVQIGLAAKSNHVHFLAEALGAGAAGHYDYITLHPYELVGLLASGFEPAFMAVVPTLRKMLADRDPARADVPVWFTEVGAPVGDDISPRRQAAILVEVYAMALAQGVARVCWFEPLDGDSGPFGLVDRRGTDRPALVALSTLITHLGQRPQAVGWVQREPGQYVFVFRGASLPVAVAWSSSDAAGELSLGQPVTVIDPVTGGARRDVERVKLGREPVLLVGVGQALLKDARRGRGRPFPWGGDFSRASSVDFSAQQAARGLHPLGPCQRVRVGGSLACDASGGAAQRFAVDPNFLAYDTVPVEVTVRVRRTGNAAAGFNLKYESVDGWKGEGTWYTVPAGAGWHEKRWVLRDPRFVGKWGYHLALDSDSPGHAAYLLERIRVRRIEERE